MQRALIAIPHFFDRSGSGDPKHDSARAASIGKRAQVLSTLIWGLHERFGQQYLVAQHSQQNCVGYVSPEVMQLDIVLITNGQNHLIDHLSCPATLYRRVEASGDPKWLGLTAHKLIAQGLGKYDWYCYLEDDLTIEDPLFFRKLRFVYDLFDGGVGADTLLQPARFETARDADTHALPSPWRLYPDFECAGMPYFDASPLQLDMMGRIWTLEPARHPHSGCFFLDQRRAELFVQSKYCGQDDEMWVTPLDTTATWAVMKTFRLYKPARDSLAFLEVRHMRPAMLGDLRPTGEGTYTWRKP